MIIVPLYENKDDVINTYQPLHTAMVKLAASYTDEELALISQFLGQASAVLEEQIDQLGSTARGKSSS